MMKGASEKMIAPGVFFREKDSTWGERWTENQDQDPFSSIGRRSASPV